jgi:nitrous oxidase accessory protein NosD
VPPSEAGTLGIEPGQIWGLGRGDYKARLVIDRPWKFEAAVETPLL